MLIRIGYDISYSVPQPTAMVLMLYTHPSRASSILKPERLVTEPPVEACEYLDAFGNRCARIVAPAGVLRLRCDAVISDNGEPDPVNPEAREHPVNELPVEALPFLLGSRYCELEKLLDRAWTLFGSVAPGWSRVQAICDWVHSNVVFGYEFARGDRTAFETAQEGRGVCRDFTHLAVALCRCMNIPARYATGYLGDIGAPASPSPMDFSAWFQVYLSGRWHTFDARHNTRRVGRILMAQGKDAADVALTTTFGKHRLENFTVWTEEISEAEAGSLSSQS